ncbi:MAG: hypothetical protein ACOYYU_11805 [Chloroflexota bacterium]
MKNRIIFTFLLITLAACTPVAGPAETPARPTLSTMLAAVTPSPLPTQLTIVPTLNPTQTEQQEEIKGVIQAYFDLRYQALSVSPPEDFQTNGFGDLVSDGPDARDFLVTEMGKLAVERKHYELNQLRYVKYEYFLDFSNIEIDSSAQRAVVSLLERFDAIREKAVELNPEDPHISRMGGLEHEINLYKEHDQWKIVSDIYYDHLWRILRQPLDASTEEILHNINIQLTKLETKAPPTP